MKQRTHFPYELLWIFVGKTSTYRPTHLVVVPKGLRLLTQQGHQWQHFLVKFIPIYTITTYLSTILQLFLISFMFHVETSQNISLSNSVFISHFLHPSYGSTEHVMTTVNHNIPNHVIPQNVYLLHSICEYSNYCFVCLTNQRIYVT
jgi:hypothetical protein